MNSQPKLNPKAKEWEKALDEDFRTIKKAKKFIEERDNNNDTKSIGSNNNHLRKVSNRRENKQPHSTVPIFKV